MCDVVDRALDIEGFRGVEFKVGETLITSQMRYVIGVTRDQVVQGNDAMALRQQPVAKVGAEKTHSTRDYGDWR